VKSVLERSLVLYLPLGESGGGSFMSGDACGHRCTVTGAVWKPYGYSFDGVDDEILVPHHDAFNFDYNEPFSILFWFKIADASNTQYLVAKHDAAYKGYGVVFRKTSNVLELNLEHDNGSWLQVRGTTALSTGAWYHGAIIYNGSTDASGVAIYINAEAEPLNILKNALVSGTQNTVDLRLGQDINGNGDFNGSLSELLVYNRVLAPAEIQRHYLAGKWRYR